MLLFQYGTYDWGEGRLFEVDFTRQFYQFFADAEDHEVIQQSFTFYFDPERFQHVEAFDLWSNAAATLAEYENAIVSSQGSISCWMSPREIGDFDSRSLLASIAQI